jgi:hypothetical protein
VSDRAPDGRAICIMLCVTMFPVVVAAMLHGGAFGSGDTLCAGLAMLGAAGLLARRRAPARLPPARARPSRSRRTR